MSDHIVRSYDADLEGLRRSLAEMGGMSEREYRDVRPWIIEGARRFIAADFKLDPPPCVREAVEEYKADNDWLAHFLEDCCEIGKDYSEKSGVVLATYREWSTRMGEFPRRQDEFKAALEGVGIRWKKTKQGNFYRGLKLLPEWF